PDCVLIVQRSDRLARGDGKNARSLVEIVLWAIKHDVGLHSVMDPEMFTEGDMALLMAAVRTMKGHGESKVKGGSIKDGLRRAAEAGKYAGSRPYGYRRRDRTEEGGETGPLVIDDAEAAVVRRVFAEYLAGRAQNAIARGLQREGVPTLSGGAWF